MGFEEFRVAVLTILLEKHTARDPELQEALADRGFSVPPSAVLVGMLALVKTGLVWSVRVSSTGDVAKRESIYWISDAGKTLLASTPKRE